MQIQIYFAPLLEEEMRKGKQYSRLGLKEGIFSLLGRGSEVGPSIQKFKVRFHWGVWLCFAIFKRLEDFNCLLRYVAWGLKTKAFPPPGSLLIAVRCLNLSVLLVGPRSRFGLWSLVHRSQTALPRACPASWAPASIAYVSLVA